MKKMLLILIVLIAFSACSTSKWIDYEINPEEIRVDTVFDGIKLYYWDYNGDLNKDRNKEVFIQVYPATDNFLEDYKKYAESTTGSTERFGLKDLIGELYFIRYYKELGKCVILEDFNKNEKNLYYTH